MNPVKTWTVAALTLAMMASVAVQAASVTDLPIGSPTPAFRLATADGHEVSLRNEHGQPIVLLFADLEQTNSQLAISDLQEVMGQEDLGSRVHVFVITTDPPTTDTGDVPFTTLINQDRSVFADYGVVSALPCTVFLDANGLLHWVIAGYVTGYADTSEDEIAYLCGRITDEELMQRRQGPSAVDMAETRNLRRLNLADQMRRRGLSEQARAEYEAVLADMPNSPVAHLGLALIGLQDGDLPGAESHARAALDAAPNLPLGLKTLAQILLFSGDSEGAREVLERFIAIAGEDAEIHYMMGRIEEAEGRDARAMSHYRMACEDMLHRRQWSGITEPR